MHTFRLGPAQLPQPHALQLGLRRLGHMLSDDSLRLVIILGLSEGLLKGRHLRRIGALRTLELSLSRRHPVNEVRVLLDVLR